MVSLEGEEMVSSRAFFAYHFFVCLLPYKVVNLFAIFL